MRITILASGSGGNATLIESAGTRILVDAGIGPRTLARRLRETGTVGWPEAIVVTHAHADHVGHCARLAQRSNVPVYATEATRRSAELGANVQRMPARGAFGIGAISVATLPVPHDAAQVALVFDDGRHRVGIATDLGACSGALLDHVADCDALLLESNHDGELLERGPYPESLKRRIRSARGHLSNAQAGELLRRLGPSVRQVVLMHLSETNNRPELARESAAEALSGRDVRLSVAHQKHPIVVELAGSSRGRQLVLPGTCAG